MGTMPPETAPLVTCPDCGHAEHARSFTGSQLGRDAEAAATMGKWSLCDCPHHASEM